MADYNYRRSINDFTISLNMHINVLLCIFVICLLFMYVHVFGHLNDDQ